MLTIRKPQNSRDEIAQRGTRIYDRDIRSHVETGNEGKIVAIDVGTGAYELGDDIVSTSDRLLARCPDAQIWFERVGHPAVYRIGRQDYALYVEVRAGASVTISALPWSGPACATALRRR